MSKISVSESKEKDAKTWEFDVPIIPEGEPQAIIDTALAKIGVEVVASHITASLKIAAQGVARAAMKVGKSKEEIQTLLVDWKPGVRKPGKSASEKATDAFSKLTPEEKKALLKSLKG